MIICCTVARAGACAGAEPASESPDKETGRQVGDSRRRGDRDTVASASPGLPVSRSPGQSAGWSIGLRHPLRPQQRLGQFILRDEALSTSGSGTQFFRHRDRRFGHIIDPRTGWPAKGLYSATVIAPTAAEAEAFSTAFYVMGPEQVADFCSGRPQLAALLVAPAARAGDVELQTFGLDDTRWRSFGC